MVRCLERLKLIVAYVTMIWIRFDDLDHPGHRIRHHLGVLTPMGIKMGKMLLLHQFVFAPYAGG
jgi:hypothetical protein